MRRVFGLAALSALVLVGQNRPFTVDSMMTLARISDPQLSPDGRTVAFTVQTINVPQNTKPKQLYVVPLDGGAPRQITSAGDNDRARWSPDSRRIVFTSTRSGSSQLWVMNADGTGAQQLTNLSTEASGEIVSPDGKKLVFLSDVYPECTVNSVVDDNCNRQKIEAEKNSKVHARIYTSLLYRHWTQWKSKRRQHLVSMDITGGPVHDLTPGDQAVPPFTLGGPEGYSISPESSEVAYVMNADPNLATSTNSDIFVVPIGGGESRKITSNPAADDGPTYSPDGKYLAYRAQARPGYESDRWRLIELERATGVVRELTEALDRSVESITWGPDSTRLFFTVVDRGRTPLQMVSVNGGGFRSIISGPSSIDNVQFTSDGKTLVYTEQRGNRPTEIFKAPSTGGSPVPLTRLNESNLSTYWLPPLEEFWVEGAEGATRSQFPGEAAGFPSGSQISGPVPDPRGAAGGVGGKLELSLESAGVRGVGICGGDAEPARLLRLRPEVHG